MANPPAAPAAPQKFAPSLPCAWLRPCTAGQLRRGGSPGPQVVTHLMHFAGAWAEGKKQIYIYYIYIYIDTYIYRYIYI